jgi:hypothetical protein
VAQRSTLGLNGGSVDVLVIFLRSSRGRRGRRPEKSDSCCIGEQELGGESSYGSICDRLGLWLKVRLVCCRVIEE